VTDEGPCLTTGAAAATAKADGEPRWHAFVGTGAALCSLAFVGSLLGLLGWFSLDDQFNVKTVRPFVWPWMGLGVGGFVLLLFDKYLDGRREMRGELIRRQEWKSSPEGQAHAAAMRAFRERLRELNAGSADRPQGSDG
jgi:hypothetical protein